MDKVEARIRQHKISTGSLFIGHKIAIISFIAFISGAILCQNKVGIVTDLNKTTFPGTYKSHLSSFRGLRQGKYLDNHLVGYTLHTVHILHF